MNVVEVKSLYDLAADVLMDIIHNEELYQTTDQRKRRALEQVSDATQSLYAACVNLGLIVDDD